MSTPELSAPSSEPELIFAAPSSERKKKKKKDKTGESSTSTMKTTNSTWPNLLAKYDSLNVRTGHPEHAQHYHGYSPLSRPLELYLRYGVINIDKPSHKTSHQLALKIKDLFRSEKTRHTNLSYKATGSLLVFLDCAARLLKTLEAAGSEYICTALLHSAVTSTSEIARVLDALTGTVLQRHPVEPRPRSRTIYGIKLLEHDTERHRVLFWISCEAGTNVRSHCVHLGLLLGVGAHMEELRRVRYTCLGESDNMVTINTVIEAKQFYDLTKDESDLREVVMPVEVLLTNFKRLVVQDSVVYRLCHGKKLMIPGLLRFENDIVEGEEIVMITIKGEAIGIGVADMSSAVMSTSDSGIVARIKRVVMDRDMYPRQIQHIQKEGMGAVEGQELGGAVG